MTRLLLVFLLCVLGSVCRAEYLSPEQALQRFSDEGSRTPALRTAAREGLTLARTLYGPDKTPAVYEFHGKTDSRILFLSADTRGESLLGYTEQAGGSVPPQLEAWLEGYAAEISSATEPSASADARAVRRQTSRPALLSFIPTKWDQGEPYNNLCPELRGEHCYTGCVATAFAQVMKHYNYPEHGTGFVSYQCNSGLSYSPYYYFGRLSMQLEDVPLDWNLMLDTYDSEHLNDEHALAVSRLMQAVGYSSEMGYSLVGSGAATETATRAMVENFGYNEATTLIPRSFYGREAWESLIYENLRSVGPLVYHGGGLVGSGHAFVCDGYEDGLFHFNWGWSGYYDGFYRLTALAPGAGGIGGSVSNDFSFGQGAVFNMTLPGKPTIDIARNYLACPGSLEAIEQGVYISVYSPDQWSVIYNASNEVLSFWPWLKMTDSAGNTRTVRWAYSQGNLDEGYGYGSMEFILPDDLAEGLYRCTVFCELEDGTEVPLAVPTGCTDYFFINRQENGVEVLNPAQAELTVSNFKPLSRIYGECLFHLEYTVTNNTGSEITDGLQAVVYSVNESGVADIIARAEGSFIDLLPGESENVDLVTEMYMYELPDAETEYYLGLLSSKLNRLLASVKIDYEESPGFADVVGTSFAVEGDSRDVDANDAAFNIGLECLEGYFAATVQVVVCDTRDFSLVASLSSQPAFLQAGTSGSVQARGQLPGAKKGDLLYAYAYETMNYTEVGDFIYLSIGKSYESAGVDNVVSAPEVEINYDAATARLDVDAATALALVELYDLSGRRQTLAADIDGTHAGATLAGLPAGVYLLRVVTKDGKTVNGKLLR